MNEDSIRSIFIARTWHSLGLRHGKVRRYDRGDRPRRRGFGSAVG